MKKLLLLLYICCFLPSCFAQSPPKKWTIVQDLQDRIVYLDTSAIKQYENQLSFWGLTHYREPQRLNPFNALVQEVKSNFLVNTVTNTYSVIGTLYYESTGKIVGESSEPRITGQDKFELPLQSGSSVSVLYNKAINFLTGGVLTSEPGEYDPITKTQDTSETTQILASESETKQPTIPRPGIDTVVTTVPADEEPVKLSPEENIAIVDEQNKEYLDEQKRIADSIETSTNFVRDETPEENAVNETQIIPVVPPNDDKLPIPIPDLPVNTPEPAPKNISNSYNDSMDRNIRGNYWSDGNTFVIQLSSWKRINIAEQQVDKYKAQGHNAFIMQVKIPGRGTWYRVRVGYFNTLEEAQTYKQVNNL